MTQAITHTINALVIYIPSEGYYYLVTLAVLNGQHAIVMQYLYPSVCEDQQMCMVDIPHHITVSYPSTHNHCLCNTSKKQDDVFPHLKTRHLCVLFVYDIIIKSETHH